LFGRHVGEGASDGADAGERLGEGVVFVGGDFMMEEFGEAEVEEFGHAGVLDHDVGGLEVAVDDAKGVGGGEGGGDLAGVREAVEWDGTEAMS
jgi:hypothetical protein